MSACNYPLEGSLDRGAVRPSPGAAAVEPPVQFLAQGSMTRRAASLVRASWLRRCRRRPFLNNAHKVSLKEGAMLDRCPTCGKTIGTLMESHPDKPGVM